MKLTENQLPNENKKIKTVSFKNRKNCVNLPPFLQVSIYRQIIASYKDCDFGQYINITGRINSPELWIKYMLPGVESYR